MILKKFLLKKITRNVNLLIIIVSTQGQLVIHPGHHHRDNNDDDDGSDYDPNLICPTCHVQYRFGEIQKLRRHINEYCTGSADY